MWSIVGNAASKGLIFLSSIYVARVLESELFGEYGFFKNLIINLGMFSTFGLGYTATKFIAEAKDEKYKSTLSRISLFLTLIFSLFLVFIFLFISFFSNENFFQSLNIIHLKPFVPILMLLLILNAIVLTQIGIIAGYGLFRKLAKVNSAIGVFSFISSVLFVYCFSFKGAIYSLFLIQLLNVVLNWFILRNTFANTLVERISIHEIKAYSKKLLKYSIPISLQEITYSLTSILSFSIIVKISGPQQLGLFNAASQWMTMVILIPSILRNVLLKHFAEDSTDLNKLHNKVKYSLKTISILSITIAAFCMILFPIIQTYYGKTFDGLIDIVYILLISSIFMSISTVINQYLMSINKNWKMLFIRLLRDFLIIILGTLLILYSRFSGAISMSIAFLFSNIVYFFILMICFKSEKVNKI